MQSTIQLSRRHLLLGSLALPALSLFQQGFVIKRAEASEIRPKAKMRKHYFAFDTGIYHGNKMQNMQLVMGQVVKDSHNPLFIDGLYETPSKAWEPRIDNGYPNVILDDKGVYHCYYTLFVVDPSSSAYPSRADKQNQNYATKDRKTGLAYARSEDGIHWHKPELNLVEFNGSKANNLLMLDVAGTGVMFEPNEADPQKRFKLITRKESGKKPLAVAFSADGVHFSALQEWAENSPVLGADCHNAVFKDSRTGDYILSTRLWANNVRVVALSRSQDFIHWSPLEEVLRGEGFERQIYSMPIFEYQDLYFGLASVYQQGDLTEPDFDTLNLELYWSSNLTEWNKAVPAHNLLLPQGLGRERFLEGEFDSATVFASPMMAGEKALYYMGGRGRHRSWRESGLGLAYLDKNKLAGMKPRKSDKPMVFSTQAFKFLSEELYLWLDLEPNGHFSVEIEKQAGFEAENCQLEAMPAGYFRVSWKNQSLKNLTENSKKALKITAYNANFWGISGDLEMDESRNWKG